MKKMALVLSLVLLISVAFPLDTAAANESFDLYLNFNKEHYEIGETVIVQLCLDRTDSDESFTIYSYEGGVLFKPLYLEYVGSSPAEGIRVGEFASDYNEIFKSVNVVYHSMGTTSPITRQAKLVLAEMTFTAKAYISSTTLIHHSPALRVGSSASAAILNAIDGTIKIGNPAAPAFAVSFSSGEESVTGTAPAAVDDKAEGDLLTLPACSWLREGYTFAGWSDGVSVLDAGAQYTMPAAAVTFTAQWTRDPVKRNIRFTAGNLSAGETASGQAPEPRQLFPGEKLSLPTQNTLALTGFSFEGWSLEDGLYQPGDVYTVPDGDVTFAAVWKSIDVGTTTGGGGTVVPAEDVEPPQAWTNPFRDVRESDWFYQYVQYANEKNLMGGTEDDLFSPLTPMNRAMMVTVLYRAAGSPAVTGASPFSDVPAGTWYTDAVIWAASGGIVDGMDSEHFAPLQNLSRQQMVTILWRLRGRPQSADTGAAAAAFADWDEVENWARDAFAWAVQQEIINGIDGNAVPGGTATRAQFAAVMSREGAGS